MFVARDRVRATPGELSRFYNSQNVKMRVANSAFLGMEPLKRSHFLLKKADIKRHALRRVLRFANELGPSFSP